MDIDLAEIAELFIEESVEGLDIMESGLLNLDLGAADTETMNAIFRAAHSIKGGGATFGFTEISEFAHHVETLLDEMRQELRPVTRESVDLLLQSVDCMREMTNALATGEVDTTRAKEIEIELEKILSSDASASGTKSEEPAASEQVEEKAKNSEPSEWEIYFKPAPEMFKTCNDPLRILIELEQLGELFVECEGAEALAFGEFDPEESHLAWNIVLIGTVSREQIDEVFAWVEDQCDLSIECLSGETAAAEPSEAKEEVVQAETEKAKIAAAPATKTGKPKPAAKSPASKQESSSIRVNIDKVDALINLVGELVITQSMLSRFNGEFDLADIQALREGLTQLSRNTLDLQESVIAIRMMPISVAFSRFPRLVRDTGNALSKNVELKLTGESTELDKTVLEKIGDPLVHLVRNSLDHGLETPDVRKAAGKPDTGILELNAYHEGGNIVIEVIDDGAGINKDKVLEKARERGLVGPDEQLSDDRINNLIFEAGFSTADAVSDLSGRGVGMDVVRRNISDLGGSVSVRSETGIGSTFRITLPLTLAILEGQLLRVGSQSYIVPLVSIVETIQTGSEKINKVVGKSEMFKLRDEYLPVVRLHEIFDIEAVSTDINDGLLVVAEANGQRMGIFVDDLLEQQQVVIKSLEDNYHKMPGISGATILGDGAVALILDMPGLLQLFFDHARGDASIKDAAA